VDAASGPSVGRINHGFHAETPGICGSSRGQAFRRKLL
jgi:hypothetical protein